MCVFHDMGEAFTGDIPSFLKTKQDEERETRCIREWLCLLPEPYCSELKGLFDELEAHETLEAKIYKALDNLEAVFRITRPIYQPGLITNTALTSATVLIMPPFHPI